MNKLYVSSKWGGERVILVIAAGILQAIKFAIFNPEAMI